MGRGRWLLVLSLLAATACGGDTRTAGQQAPSPSPVAELTATAASPAAFEPANIAADRDFIPAGVWFLDGSEGWVIGGGCSDGKCLLHTRDGGRHWERIGA